MEGGGRSLQHIFVCKKYADQLELDSAFDYMWIYQENIDNIHKVVEVENIIKLEKEYFEREMSMKNGRKTTQKTT